MQKSITLMSSSSRAPFYSMRNKKNIVYMTFNYNEVKDYVYSNFLNNKPEKIFGDDDNSECIICMSTEKDSIFSPCGHFVSCKECSLKCSKCPICRTFVTQLFNKSIFFSL